MSTQTKAAVGVHLVGGLDAPDAETAMRTVARLVGKHVHAIPDGETGDRRLWIQYQINKLLAIDGIDKVGEFGWDSDAPDAYSDAEYPVLVVSPAVTEIPPRSLGYADDAAASYEIFKRLRNEGVIAQGVKFQVSLPTPYATVSAWIRPDHQEAFLPIYADAMEAEAKAIAEIVGEDLYLQYDVAMEFGVLTGSLPAGGNLGEKPVVIETLRDAVSRAPEGVPVALHLCYGDYMNQHFVVPQDLSLCVELANAVVDHVDLVHMPVDHNTGRNPKYFAALKDLAPTPLALGVVDYDGDLQRTNELIEAAITGGDGRPFNVATECGMARIADRGVTTLEHLLELHAKVAAPVR